MKRNDSQSKYERKRLFIHLYDPTYEIIFSRAILSQIIELDNWESKDGRLERKRTKEMKSSDSQ